jgi:hypothetical protein
MWMMNKEGIYDTQINPLMNQIISICREHKIAMLADFSLDKDLRCTTTLLSEEYHPTDEQLAALECIKPHRTFAMSEVVSTKPDGSKHITLTRIS